MAAADSALNFVENDLRATFFIEIDGCFLQGLTMANARENAGTRRNGVGNEMEFFRRQTIGIELGYFSLMDVKDVFFDVFFDDIPRGDVLFAFHTANAETFMLADGVVIDAFVGADDFVVQGAYLPFFHGDIIGKKRAEIPFADKAHAGGVFFRGGSQSVLFGKAV